MATVPQIDGNLALKINPLSQKQGDKPTRYTRRFTFIRALKIQVPNKNYQALPRQWPAMLLVP